MTDQQAPVWKTRYTRPLTLNLNESQTYTTSEVIERGWIPMGADGKYFLAYSPALTENPSTNDYGRPVFLIDGKFAFVDIPTGFYFLGYSQRSGQRWAVIMQRGRVTYGGGKTPHDENGKPRYLDL